MDVRTFPVLTDEDEALVSRLSIGLGENAARVLAYLLCRLADPELADAATRTAVHIGAGVTKNAATDALATLVAADLIAETTATTTAPGRPPKAWYAVAPRSETIRRTDAHHADRLLEQGLRYATDWESSSAGTASSTGASDRAVPDRSTLEGASLALNWQPNALHLPLFATRTTDVGGGSISIEEYDGSRAATEAVASGACEIGVAGAATILRERERRRPIVPLAVLFQRSLVVLYTTRTAFGGPFETVEQLRGRRVGMPDGTETGLLGRLLLEQAGIRESVDLVDVDGEERDALRSGAVDAVTGMAPDPERLETADRSVDEVAVADGYPAYGPALIVRADVLRRQRSRLVALLAATTGGWANAVRDPAAVANDLADEMDGSPERIGRTFERVTDRFATSDAVRRRGWGWHSPTEWRNLRDALAQGGLLPGE
ncbi:ABC transporter substrate-binding protein [Natrinema ejinorense]|uniref:Thiamine pyrimidine synthase n=1 Tax=Natrinema ejinorense TaxID=373386 RepID=A0A2A5QTD3_9EURY|nr:ABC transporter substrate-binding protein [Natrinema ejinorense]PCR90091.1 hypothetical protein CP557_05760 [Natrinema ejinorense]